jgi:DNA-binding transcriptional ArsR family regulator
MSLGDGPDRPGAKRGQPAMRQINDAKTMRALSHPVRIALLEMLSIEGPLTATEVGERIGESPTTCSFHLRQLAKYGLVEEAGGGKGRARPWRMKTLDIAIRGHDPEAELAAGVLAGMILERQRERYRTWQDTKAAYPSEWRKAAGESDVVVYLTAEELKQLRDQLSELLRPLVQERDADPSKRPPGSAPVEMVMLSYPLSPPADTPPTDTPPTDIPATDTSPTDTPPTDTPPTDIPATDTSPTDTPRSAS